jgi:hypothetical protein
MSRPNDIPTKADDLIRIEAEARRMRARFLADAFARLFARLRGAAAAPAHAAKA